jgi:Domain of unknown function (DUF4203)
MLPHAYELPTAVLLVLVGALTCFAGYKLFRIVLTIWGFILGAMLGSSIVGVSSAAGMVVAGLVGGLLGALVLVFAYFVGVALVGAGLGVLVAHLTWSQLHPADPPAAVIVIASIVGAVGAMVLQRYVTIVGTAFAGAWMTTVGALAAVENVATKGAMGAASGVWILYPLSAGPEQRWVLAALVAVGLIGTAVQLSVTGRKR